MIDDPLEEIKAYSQAAFLGTVACRRKGCPYCNSPTLLQAWTSGADLSGPGGGGGESGSGVCAAPLKLLLVGQHALAQTLRQAVLRDLLDRITVRYHLHPLDRDQTAAYLDFQMKQAGGTGKEFDAASKSLIHDYTGGVPRQVNNLATACLLQAAAANTHHITEAVLQQTLTEFQLP